MDRWAPLLSREKLPAECPQCRYALDGLTTFRCPECGADALAVCATGERELTNREAEWLHRASWLDPDTATDVGCGIVGFPLGATILGILGFAFGRLNWGQLFIILGLVWGVFVPWVALRIWMDGRRMRHALGRDRADNRARIGEIEVLEAVRTHEFGSRYSRWDLRLLRLSDDLVLIVEDDILVKELGEETPRRIAIEFLPHSRRILRMRAGSKELASTAMRQVGFVDTEGLGRCDVLDMDALALVVEMLPGEPWLFGDREAGQGDSS